MSITDREYYNEVRDPNRQQKDIYSLLLIVFFNAFMYSGFLIWNYYKTQDVVNGRIRNFQKNGMILYSTEF